MKHIKDYHADYIERFKCFECVYTSPDKHKVKVHQEKMHLDIHDKAIEKIKMKNSKRSKSEFNRNITFVYID